MFKMSKYFCVFKNTERIKKDAYEEQGGKEAVLLDMVQHTITTRQYNFFCTQWLGQS